MDYNVDEYKDETPTLFSSNRQSLWRKRGRLNEEAKASFYDILQKARFLFVIQIDN